MFIVIVCQQNINDCLHEIGGFSIFAIEQTRSTKLFTAAARSLTNVRLTASTGGAKRISRPLSGFPAGLPPRQAQDGCDDGCQEKNWGYSKGHLLQFRHNPIRGSSYCPQSLFGGVLDQRLSYSLLEGKFVR